MYQAPIRALMLGLLICTGAPAAKAADIRVLTTGAFKQVVMALAPGFERNGDHLLIQNDTAGEVAKRIAAGEPFDLAILTPPTADPLIRDRKLVETRPVAAVGIGVGVKAGAPRPDLASVPSLKAALLAARSIAIIDPASGGSSGIYLMNLFDRLGIGADIRPKLILVPGGLAAERVASGEAEMAIHQQSELLAVPGVQLAGPLPDEIQNRTIYLAGLSPAASPQARSFLAALTAPETQPLLAKMGLTPP